MKGLISIMAFFCLCLCAELHCFGQTPEYCADIVQIAQGQAIPGKMFVSKDKIRIETQQAIVISRMDKNIAYLLMPDQKIYMEQPIDNRNRVVTTEKQPGEIERVLIAQEALNGRMTKKYKITDIDAQGIKAVMYQWIDTSLNLPVKTQAQDNSWSMEAKNIKVGSNIASIFEIPPDYKKFSTAFSGDMQKLINENMPAGIDSLEE